MPVSFTYPYPLLGEQREEGLGQLLLEFCGFESALGAALR